MIATTTTKLAVLMAATVLAAGLSIAPFLGAEATGINTTRSNIKSSPIVMQDADQSCTSQVQGQGGQQAVPNIEQNTVSDSIQSEGDPVPDIDVKMGRNPGGAGAGAGVSSEGDPTVDAAPSIDCSITQDLTVEQNGDTEDFSTNEWTE
jgi:hypothetical protein